MIRIDTPISSDNLIKRLRNNGYEAYYVGGCVRDGILERQVNDWDIATSATPEEVKHIFPLTIPTGEKHGTVTVRHDGRSFEVTTFRTDGNYSDSRHPDEVTFVTDLVKDLSRRDFTMNAIAYNPFSDEFIDPFHGISDIDRKIIRAVGVPDTRFKEDALRMMRMVRFSSQLGFRIDGTTFLAAKRNAELLQRISTERIRDELSKILISPNPEQGIGDLYITYLLNFIIPELSDCFGFHQHNPHHGKDVGDHILAVVQATEPVHITRLAALFHDIAKPSTFELVDGRGRFFGHQSMGADMAEEIMDRLKFDRYTIDVVKRLVADHMSRIPKLRPKNIKRLINRVGDQYMSHLFNLMRADVAGHAEPHDYSEIDNMEAEFIRVRLEKPPMKMHDLAINGDDLIKIGIEPGPKMGTILKELYEIILDNPSFNTREKLLELVPK
jgi:tRNA nucleotidyltransferase (CCA-adding enzyme)